MQHVRLIFFSFSCEFFQVIATKGEFFSFPSKFFRIDFFRREEKNFRQRPILINSRELFFTRVELLEVIRSFFFFFLFVARLLRNCTFISIHINCKLANYSVIRVFVEIFQENTSCVATRVFARSRGKLGTRRSFLCSIERNVIRTIYHAGTRFAHA